MINLFFHFLIISIKGPMGKNSKIQNHSKNQQKIIFLLFFDYFIQKDPIGKTHTETHIYTQFQN